MADTTDETTNPAPAPAPESTGKSAGKKKGVIAKIEDTIEEELGSGTHFRLDNGANGNYIVQARNNDAATVTKEELADYLIGLLSQAG